MNKDELSNKIESRIKSSNFSGTISICENEEIIYETASGYSDRSNKLKNNLETRFRIASGTKFFTALAIVKLIESGKISFDSKISEHIPFHFPKYSKKITIRHLLTHTSGIPDYYDEEKITDFNNFFVSIPWYDLKGPKDYLPILPQDEMKFNPGEKFSYSNSGFILLGVIIEEVSGISYKDYVTENIFKPIGMMKSGYFAMNRLPENTALGYIDEEDNWRTNIYNLPIIGASDGGAFTTLKDLNKLWKAFFENSIVSKDIVEIMIKPYIKAESEGKNKYYGHGIWIKKNDKYFEEYIIGCDAGISFKSSINRKDRINITVLSNTTNGAWPVFKEIYEIIYK
jgi:CubicO group peptidase (beta-lactamase class C family)